MRLLYGRDDAVAAWVVDQLPHVDSVENLAPYKAIGVIDAEGYIAAGVVFNGYQPRWRQLDISVASVTPRWASRAIITELLSYPFDELNVVRVTTVTPRRNRAALRFNRKLGFKIEGIVRRGFLNQDAMICGLLRTEWAKCRFNLNAEQATEMAA